MAAEKNIGWVIIAAMIALILWIFTRGRHVIASIPATGTLPATFTPPDTSLARTGGTPGPGISEPVPPPIVSDTLGAAIDAGAVRFAPPDSTGRCAPGFTLWQQPGGVTICLSDGDVLNFSNASAGRPLDTSVFTFT